MLLTRDTCLKLTKLAEENLDAPSPAMPLAEAVSNELAEFVLSLIIRFSSSEADKLIRLTKDPTARLAFISGLNLSIRWVFLSCMAASYTSFTTFGYYNVSHTKGKTGFYSGPWRYLSSFPGACGGRYRGDTALCIFQTTIGKPAITSG